MLLALANASPAKAVRETLISLGYEPIGLIITQGLPTVSQSRPGGKLRRNFQGYTTDDADALLGLGTSAIGRLRQGFVQNPPDTGSYSRAIMSGRFATIKGLALSADDHIRGRIIEELMCSLACNIDQVAEECGQRCASFEHEIEALRPFIAHGFAHVDGCHIAVTESGRPYLRLIAAAFDSYIPNSRAHHSIAV
jgi:oxygen-independent coproporphyrinogen-3 oxidase